MTTFRMSLATLAFALAITASARANEIVFSASSGNPNVTATANTGAYGSDANVSVGYSAYTYNWPYGGYGTIAGTGNAIYSDNYGYAETVTFTAAPGYTITLNSFDLAAYDESNNTTYAANLSVTGGTTTWYLASQYPDGTTYSTYTPNVTGTNLSLNISYLYDLGLNDITFTENAVSTTPEPPSALLGFTGILAAAAAMGRRRLRAALGV